MSCTLLGLRAYLWGIETLRLSIASFISPIHCEPTYEELKRIPRLNSRRPNVIASLPMRNWNAPYIPVIVSEDFHCEPTYEELKLTNNSFVSVAKAGIASLPMRNWNETNQEIVTQFDLDCEPTYEELKLWICREVCKEIKRIASLPMRNWNLTPSSHFGRDFMIASLPMRNWNAGRIQDRHIR